MIKFDKNEFLKTQIYSTLDEYETRCNVTKEIIEEIEKLQQENKQLKDNWNKLKQIIDVKMYNSEYLINLCGYKVDVDTLEILKIIKKEMQELEKADSITQSCIFNGKEESKISYRKCLNILDKKEAQQKEFIKYLEDEIKFYKNRDTYIVVDIHGSYDLRSEERR